MAFTCMDCYAKQRRMDGTKIGKKGAEEDFSWAPKSKGPCEDCGKTSVCIDG